jgi:hypothetical protein
MTMAFGCVWPPFSTREHLILTLAPGVLQSLVLDEPGGEPTTLTFNFQDLQPPVPAKAYQGTDFWMGDWLDDGRSPAEFDRISFGAIKEGQYMPRIVLPQELMAVDPLYSKCRPYGGRNSGIYSGLGLDKNKWLVAWDPPVALTGTVVTSLPAAEYTPVQTRKSDLPRSTAVTATSTAVYLSSRDPLSVESRPVYSNSPTSQQPSPRPQATPAPNQKPIVLLPSQPGDPSDQLRVAIGTTVATLIATGPAVTIGSQMISMNSGGEMVVMEQEQGSTTVRTVQVVTIGGQMISLKNGGGMVVMEQEQGGTKVRTVQAAIPSIGLQRTDILAASGSVTRVNRSVSSVRSVEGNKSNQETADSIKVATTTTSKACRTVSFPWLSLAWCNMGYILVLLSL